MTTWTEYINQINTDFDEDSPILSAVNIGTGMILNGNLRQSKGEIQANGLKLDNVSLTTIQTGSESFADNDTSIMTSAAIQDKIEAYGYSTTTGDITGVTAGTGLSGGGASGTVTLNVAGLTVSELHADALQTSGESFADNDTSVMTSAAIQDKIESYGYSTTTGDITGVTAGTGLSGGGASGSVTLNVSGVTLSEIAGSAIITSSESFADNDTTVMTSAAVQDKIESYGYTTATGDITGVTAGTGLSGGGASGAVTLNVSGLTVSEFAGASIQTGSESFADNDTTLMTSAAVQDKILSYSYITGVTNISGNAGTATALETARNIGGVSFDGTGNIDLPGVNTGGNQATSGNAATATALATARAINGVDFDGTAAITVTADANTLSGTTLKSSVVNSSLTSVGTLSSLSTGDITLNGTAITSTAAELNILDGSGTSWTEGTPSWTNLTVGNASINTIRHIVIGKVCVAQFRLTFGSTTSVGGTVSLATPVNADYDYWQMAGNAWFYDKSGSKLYQGQCVITSATKISLYGIFHAVGNYSYSGSLTAATPASSWGTNDIFTGQVVYRVA